MRERNTDLYKIPIKYMYWYFNRHFTQGLKIRELPISDAIGETGTVPVIEFDSKKYVIR
jgi:hypothetical protein